MTSPFADNHWFDEVRQLTEALVATPTISPDVACENRCAEQIAALLHQHELHPERWPTGDGRHSVACLLRGQHPSNDGRTIILMGHYDIVGVDEFKAIDPAGEGAIAFAPERLRAALLAALRADDHQQPETAQLIGDLTEQHDGTAGWRWMFGRGSADMKSGVAINIALMRQLWRDRARLAGNLLFLACPDEENESAGILSAVPQLLALRQEHGLRYLGVINTDYTAARGSDESERYIYTGVVGKLLPSFYILGDPTHVAEPFRGLDANQVAAELVRRLNLNVDLCDTWPAAAATPDEVALPPITLKLRGLKSTYNVQTTAEAFIYVNWLTYSRSPGQALHGMIAEAQGALASVLAARAAQAQRFKGQLSAQQPEQTGVVLSFADLCRRVRAARGWPEAAGDAHEDSFEQWLSARVQAIRAGVEAQLPSAAALAAHLADAGDSREISRLIVAELVREAGLKGPAIIVFFSPPYYPHIQPQPNDLTPALTHVLAQLSDLETIAPGDPPLKRLFQSAVKAPADPPIQLRSLYPYIADLSYLGLDDSIRPHIQALIDNMPLFGRGYSLDFDALQALDCPVLNIGPLGKNAHGLYECVDMPYSFAVVPQLIYETVCAVLARTSTPSEL
jgi:arginine utilization protein RocB